jgi:transcription elongation factor Elf1
MDPSDDCSALRFECPRCGHVEADDYEVIDRSAAVDWRCESCLRLFSVLLTECEHCGCEGVHSALSSAEQDNPNHVRCQHCGKPSLRHEDLAESSEAL